MTKERQDDVRSKLYRVLGGEGIVKPSSSSSEPTSASGQNVSNLPCETSNDSGLKPNPSQQDSEFQGTISVEDDQIGTGGFEYPPGEWECTTCTLVNLPDDEICVVCGIPRYNDLYAY
jgi:hypothetical protein